MDSLDVKVEIALAWKPFLTSVTLVVQLFQVDCFNVRIEAAFLCKPYSAKFTFVKKFRLNAEMDLFSGVCASRRLFFCLLPSVGDIGIL